MLTNEALQSSELIGAVPDYFVTVYTDNAGKVGARQINNVIDLPPGVENNLQKLMEESAVTQINIRYDQLTALEPQFTPQPVNVIFFSSIGAMYGAEMNVRQPSDGMWALAEIFSRENLEVSCLCIDPNINNYDEVKSKLEELKIGNTPTIFGISSLVQNLPNESVLVNQLSADFPNARIVFGGIGSETLSLLPTTDEFSGIEGIWDNVISIPGTAVLEFQALLRRIYTDADITIDVLRKIIDEEGKKYTEDNWGAILSNLQNARAKSRSFFIPLQDDRKRLFFDQSYAQMRTNHAMSMSVTDNTCQFTCWFCATPKGSRFGTKEEEFAFIVEVVSNQEEFAFNNNDLAADPDKTIWLCEQMAADSALQIPKHGKMSASEYRSDLIDALAKAGFIRIAIGVETFDVHHRTSLKGGKFEDPESINKTLAHLLRVGITPEINLILFHPNETSESLSTTAREALKWVSEGAIVNATLGVNAIPNSHAVKKILEKLKKENLTFAEKSEQMKRRFETTEIQGTNGHSILFPVQWIAKDSEIQLLKFAIRKQRLEIINHLQGRFGDVIRQNYVPIESFIALLLIQSRLTRIDIQIEQVENYISQFTDRVYVGI